MYPKGDPPTSNRLSNTQLWKDIGTPARDPSTRFGLTLLS